MPALHAYGGKKKNEEQNKKENRSQPAKVEQKKALGFLKTYTREKENSSEKKQKGKNN